MNSYIITIILTSIITSLFIYAYIKSFKLTPQNTLYFLILIIVMVFSYLKVVFIEKADKIGYNSVSGGRFSSFFSWF